MTAVQTGARTLTDLLGTEDGRRLLAERGVHSDVDDFLARLRPPEDPELNTLLGLPADALLVHLGQQVCLDYEQGTLTKYTAAAGLAGHPGAAPALLWHDADRADSERFGMRMVLPSGSRQIGVWFGHKSHGVREPRFVPVDRATADRALQELGQWVTHSTQMRPKPERRAAADRHAALAAAVAGAEVETLAQVNTAVAEHLLGTVLDLRLPSTHVSTMLDAGMLTASLEDYLARLDEIVAVFNESVEELLALGVDPHVKPLAPDYLPLHYSCPADGHRLRLRHVRDGADHLALAACRCGLEHRFDLGRGTATLGELAAAGRWSTDVSLPVHHDHLASGWIVGRSTALYGLVLNRVMERVLDRQPVPALVPPDLHADQAADADGDTLLVAHLLGRDA